MLNRRVDASRIKLAQIKWFDTAKNDVESYVLDTYAFLYEKDGHYINPFNAFLELPVYEEVPNSIQSSDQTSSSVLLVDGEEREGVCYVIESDKPEDLLGSDTVSTEDLINYMVSSDNFFIDRLPYLTKALNEEEYDPKKIQELVTKILSDKNWDRELSECFKSPEKSKQLLKKLV